MTTGIYQIRNKVNGKVYIGHSTDVQRRWSHHRLYLAQGTHHNSYLQYSYNLHGADNFEFTLLEQIIDISKLATREQSWVDLKKAYNPDFGYNFSPCVLSPTQGTHRPDAVKQALRAANLGKNHPYKSRSTKGKHISLESLARRFGRGAGIPRTEEVKEKLRQANLGKKASLETRLKLSKIQKGRKHTPMSAETKDKLRVAHLGRALTAEHKEKIRAGNIGKKHNRCGSIPV